mgnify:CR=1 FL=1
MTTTAELLAAEDNDHRNRERTLRWRDQCVIFLRTHGLPAGRPLLPSSGAWTDRGQVDGLTGWTVLCRRQKTMDLRSSLDAAKDRASLDGSKYAAVVFHARAREIDAAYVAMTFDQFAELLANQPMTTTRSMP